MKNFSRIEICPDDNIQKYEKEVNQILEFLGHPEALVTDRSSIFDFS